MGKSKDLAGLGGGSFSKSLTITGSANDANILTTGFNQTNLSILADSTDGELRLSTEDGSGNNYTKYMTFYTEGGSGPTERMRIDASGRVTMPYQPSFRVVLQTSNGTSSTTSQLVNWGVQHNIGGHFSTSTSRFTAPVSGVYLMNYTGLHSSNGANTGYWVRMYFMVNGTAVLDGLGDNGTYGSYQRLSVSAQFYLNAGDYVTTHAQSNQTNSTGVYSGYTHWSGHLIG